MATSMPKPVDVSAPSTAPVQRRGTPGRGSASLLASLNVATAQQAPGDARTTGAGRREPSQYIDPEFGTGEWCLLLRDGTIFRAAPEKSSRELGDGSRGERVQIVDMHVLDDGCERLRCQGESGQLRGWMSCYDAKGDPLLQNIDSAESCVRWS